MKKVTLLFILLLANSIIAQNKINVKPKVKPIQKTKQDILPAINDFDKVIKLALISDKTEWSLGVKSKMEKYRPLKAENVKVLIDSFIVSPKSNECDKYYIKKYKKQLDTLFTNIKFFGDDYIQFLGIENSELPIKITNYNVTSKLLLIKGIATTDIYNTLRLSGKQRASKIITSRIIPTLKDIKPILVKDFDFIGFGVVFGSKDFSDESVIAIKEEYVFFIAAKSKIIQFNNKKITEDELVQSSDIYMSDREMIYDVKKIKVIIE